jgi:hypothetical protein
MSQKIFHPSHKEVGEKMPGRSKWRKLLSIFLGLTIAFVGGIFFGEWTSPAVAKGHEAHHGGVLNVIGDEVGHVEIRLTDELVELWFVGGGNDTDRAVPIKADKIRLTVEKELILNAAPLVLAGETEGNCSHFSAHCDWLGSMKEFVAQGHVMFKGQEFELSIRYPHGYDPHHGHGHEHEHHEHHEH